MVFVHQIQGGGSSIKSYLEYIWVASSCSMGNTRIYAIDLLNPTLSNKCPKMVCTSTVLVQQSKESTPNFVSTERNNA